MIISASELRPLVGDLRQIASVRRIVLDDGPERGVRALAFSTGGGLDFWVMADRSLDIGTLSWRGVQLGWQSPAGFRSPAFFSPESNGGRGFGRSFGGFLVSCGLDHIRHPHDGLPLHGHLPHTPARVTAYGEAWSSAKPVLYCEGEVVQWRHGGETFCLSRRIEAPIGGATVSIRDRVENTGPEPVPLALLYHFNLGYPAVANGTTIQLDGAEVAASLSLPDIAEPGPATLHRSSDGSTSRCIVDTPDGRGGGYSLSFRYSAPSLPFLQLWRDTRPTCGVVSIEPCTMGRTVAGENNPAAMLAPGDTATFEIRISVEDIISPHKAQGVQSWPR